METGVSRRSVAAGVAWASPAVTVAAAAPSVAASGPASGALTGVTGYCLAQTVTNGGATCSTNGNSTTASKNPSPYVYASTGVSMGAQAGASVSMVIDLYGTADEAGGSLGNDVTFVPGTYTFQNSSGNSVTATSTCQSKNARGACTAISVSWNLSGYGTTADNPQEVPFRVGMVGGTTIPSGDSVTTGFNAPVFGSGPDNVQSNKTVGFDSGTYTGPASCPA